MSGFRRCIALSLSPNAGPVSDRPLSRDIAKAASELDDYGDRAGVNRKPKLDPIDGEAITILAPSLQSRGGDAVITTV